ncbi:hypothetical protein KC323_g2869 [Hortaea werneckii]|uniref:Uncharacterized protein n=1 Tax=Hortaea werneckii TaxID=91943 RepID=A0A3M7DH19_HORWE|nr:hypothetical protein KC323_g2869 [Hortaea werneckii]RMY63631.1 hypothetical protein D0863_10395 [Hortaea werneckii]
MFATRNHNENAIYEQQTAAAAKPLNQGLKGLQPKTPGAKGVNKTPFSKKHNDENASFGAGKTAGKGGDGGKADMSAFVTPAGPRNRAPLGAKTTNAKALQTPAPGPNQEKPSAKPTSPRLRRGKVKIHTAEADPLESQDGVPDVEYMPPRGEPLPDNPDDIYPHDTNYPQFQGANMTKGWWSETKPRSNREPEDFLFGDFDKKFEELEQKEKVQKAAATASANAKKQSAPLSSRALPRSNAPIKNSAPTIKKAPSTLTSKTAASALSSQQQPKATSRAVPSFAAPTAAAKARAPSSILPSRSKPPISNPYPNVRGNVGRPGKATTTATATAPTASSHTAARVASNSTLGYSRGRQVSANRHKTPLQDLYQAPPPSHASLLGAKDEEKDTVPESYQPQAMNSTTDGKQDRERTNFDDLLGLQGLGLDGGKEGGDVDRSDDEDDVGLLGGRRIEDWGSEDEGELLGDFQLPSIQD